MTNVFENLKPKMLEVLNESLRVCELNQITQETLIEIMDLLQKHANEIPFDVFLKFEITINSAYSRMRQVDDKYNSNEQK